MLDLVLDKFIKKYKYIKEHSGMCNNCSFYSSIYKRDTFSLLPVIFAYIHFCRNVDDSQNIILPCEVQLQHSKKCQVTSSEIDRNKCAQISSGTKLEWLQRVFARGRLWRWNHARCWYRLAIPCLGRLFPSSRYCWSYFGGRKVRNKNKKEE